MQADTGAPSIVASPAFAIAVTALAAAEMGGDKWPSAPDRIIAAGLVPRILTGATVGMAVAPIQDRRIAAVLGVAGAVAGAYLSFGIRRRTMRALGQTPSGLIEDALAVAGALWLVRSARRR